MIKIICAYDQCDDIWLGGYCYFLLTCRLNTS